MPVLACSTRTAGKHKTQNRLEGCVITRVGLKNPLFCTKRVGSIFTKLIDGYKWPTSSAQTSLMSPNNLVLTVQSHLCSKCRDLPIDSLKIKLDPAVCDWVSAHGVMLKVSLRKRGVVNRAMGSGKAFFWDESCGGRGLRWWGIGASSATGRVSLRDWSVSWDGFRGGLLDGACFLACGCLHDII